MRSLFPSFVGVCGLALVACGSSSSGDGTGGANACYPDNDGISGGSYTFDITVDDTGFSKTVLSTQNDAQATVTLTNKGTKPHGFMVGCVSSGSSYPNLPAGCSATVCFPTNASIAPLQPGESKTITFDTPTPDNLIYPITSTEPGDTGSGFDGQWTLM